MKSSIKNIISLLLFLFICSVVQATSVDAMEYSELKNYSVQELIDLGDHYYFSSGKGKMDSAAVCFSIIANRQGLKHMSNNENRLCIKALNRLGYLYQYIYFDYQSSYGYYLQARDLAKQTGIKEDLPYTLRDIASLLLLNGKENNTNKSKAFNLFLESFYTSLEVRDYWAATTSFIKMMQLTRDKKEAFKKIHKEASILANLPKKPSFPHYQYALCMYNGLLKEHNGDYEGAVKDFHKMMKYDKGENPENLLRNQLEIYGLIAEVLINKGDIRQGVSYYNKIEQLASKNGLKDIEVEVYKHLYQFYTSKGNMQQGLHYKLLYLETKDSILTANRLDEVTQTYFTNKLNRLNRDAQKAAYKKQVMDYILVILAIGVVILGGMVVLLFRNNRKLEERNHALYLKSLDSVRLKQRKQSKESPENMNNLMSSKDTDDLFSKIQEIMNTSDEVWSDSFSLEKLAALCGVKSRYVSMVINQKTGNGFSSYVCEHRVNEVCRRIVNNMDFRNYTIEAIAKSVGFKSRSNFGPRGIVRGGRMPLPNQRT